MSTLIYQKPLTKPCAIDVGTAMCCQSQWDHVPVAGNWMRENQPGLYQAGCIEWAP